jgi:lysozyme
VKEICEMKKMYFIAAVALLCSFTLESGSELHRYVPYSYESQKTKLAIGIDISKFQRSIDWNAVDTNLHFIVVKATEGITLKDARFDEYWKSIHPNTVKGAYHFFNPIRGGKEQAQFFLRTVNFGKGHMAPVIDVEYTKNFRRVSKKTLARNLRNMILTIEKTLGVKPIIYTNAGNWDKYISPYFAGMEKHYHLWIADYRGLPEPKIPRRFGKWAIWQHTNKAKVRGISGCVDVNICRLEMDKLIIR